MAKRDLLDDATIKALMPKLNHRAEVETQHFIKKQISKHTNISEDLLEGPVSGLGDRLYEHGQQQHDLLLKADYTDMVGYQENGINKIRKLEYICTVFQISYLYGCIEALPLITLCKLEIDKYNLVFDNRIVFNRYIYDAFKCYYRYIVECAVVNSCVNKQMMTTKKLQKLYKESRYIIKDILYSIGIDDGQELTIVGPVYFQMYDNCYDVSKFTLNSTFNKLIHVIHACIEKNNYYENYSFVDSDEALKITRGLTDFLFMQELVPNEKLQHTFYRLFNVSGSCSLTTYGDSFKKFQFDRTDSQLSLEIDEVSSGENTKSIFDMVDLQDCLLRSEENKDAEEIFSIDLVEEISKLENGIDSSLDDLIRAFYVPNIGNRHSEFVYALPEVLYQLAIYIQSKRIAQDPVWTRQYNDDQLVKFETVCMMNFVRLIRLYGGELDEKCQSVISHVPKRFTAYYGSTENKVCRAVAEYFLALELQTPGIAQLQNGLVKVLHQPQHSPDQVAFLKQLSAVADHLPAAARLLKECFPGARKSLKACGQGKSRSAAMRRF